MGYNNIKESIHRFYKKKERRLARDDTPDISTGDESSSVLLERDKDKCLKSLSEKKEK